MIISEHAKLEIITKSNKKYDVDESYIVEKSLTTTQSCSSGGGIPAGSCNAGTMSVSFRAPAGMSKKDLFMAKIKLYVWYGSGDPKQRGEYNVTSSTKNGNVYTVSASDNIVLLDESCYSAKDVQDAENGLLEILGSTLRDPATILSFICNAYSVPHLNHDENVEKVPDSGDTKLYTSVSSECSTESVKDFASYIAEYLGAFIVADENGKVRFCRLGDRESDIEINSSNIAIGTYQRSPYYVFPSMWRVCFDSGFSNYWYAAPIPSDAAPLTVDVTNNPFWQYQEDNIPSDLYAGKTTGMIALPWDYIYNAATDENGKHLINPFSATVYVPYLFRVCDLVTIKDPDTNEKYRTYITDVTWTFRGGQTISCAGEDTRTLSVSKSRSMAKRGTDYSKYLYRKSKKSGESSNTTYKLTKTGHTISLKGSDGSESSVNDSDTVYTHPAHTSHSKGMYKFANDGLGHVSDAEKVTKDDIVDLGIPGQDTNTEYIVLRGSVKTNHGYIGGVNSLLLVDKSNYDKENEVLTSTNDLSICDMNPYVTFLENHYMNPEYTAYPMFYDAKKSGEKSGIQSVISSGKIRINQNLDGFDVDGNITASKFIGANATKTEQGLMSAKDKTKLDNIADSANNYVHPTYTARTRGFYSITVDDTGHVVEVANVTADDLPDVPRSSLPIHTARGTVGSAGYVKIATFVISSAYRDCTITVEYTRRGYIPVKLYIKWANVSSTDPDLSYFRFVHPTSTTCTAFMHKSDTSTWDLYIQKSEKNDSISIIDCKKPGHMSDVTISWADEHASSLPSGYVSATRMQVDTDSGWITLVDNVKYRKIGKIVEVRGTYTAPSSGGGMTIGTLPSGYRPSNATVYNTNSISDTASKTYYTSVNTSGTLIISSSSGSAFTQGTTYNVNIMFMVD